MTSNVQLSIVNKPVQFWSGFRADGIEIFRQRELLKAFVRREFRTRYKGAKLGWIWALVKPLITFMVYSLAVGVFLGAGKAHK